MFVQNLWKCWQTLISENFDTIEYYYQFLTITSFSLFSRAIQKRKFLSRDFTKWMVQWKEGNNDENNDYLWELTAKHKKVNIVNDFNKKIGKHYREVKQYPCLYNKAENDYKHEDLERSLWTAIAEKRIWKIQRRI